MPRLSCLAIAALTRITASVFCAVALLTAATVVCADDTDHIIAEFLDLNGDHRISYDEFVHSVAVKAMREMDRDNNGLLTPAEVAASDAKVDATSPAISFSKADTNGDGSVSIDELDHALAANPGVRVLFQNIDRDHDGFLSDSELRNSHGVPLIQFRLPF